jgi:hypothetical protein
LSALVLDAGALIAVDRHDRAMALRLRSAMRNRRAFRTSAIAVAEVWRSPTGRQAELARLLSGTEVVPVDYELARAVGVLLGASGTSNPGDATVVLVAEDGDTVLTSDPRDIATLAAAARRRLTIVPC